MRDLIEEHNSLVLLLVSKENKSATWVGWGGGVQVRFLRGETIVPPVI